MEMLKLLLVLILIVAALRWKLSVGITLFFAGIVTAFLFQIPVTKVTTTYLDLLQSETFIFLTLLVVEITFLGALLKELGYLSKLTASCRHLKGGSKTAVAILPGLVGLMPMPGGSLLSAPLVNDLLTDYPYKPEHKLLVNYWFRHIVEFVWPVYAGLILTEAITGLPMYRVSLLQFPLFLVMILIGLYFFIKPLKPDLSNNADVMKALKGIFSSLWPIGMAILLYGVLKIHLAISIGVSVVILLFITRPSLTRLIDPAKKALSVGLIFLIFGILSFQKIIELSGAVDTIPNMALTYNLPPELVIFLVCFTIGILTGMVSAYVGLGYAILAGYLYQPVLHPGYIFIAYFSGFLGIMLSPAHLCLVLTNQYFKSDLFKVYQRMLWPLLIFIFLVIIIYLSGWGDII